MFEMGQASYRNGIRKSRLLIAWFFFQVNQYWDWNVGVICIFLKAFISDSLASIHGHSLVTCAWIEWEQPSSAFMFFIPLFTSLLNNRKCLQSTSHFGIKKKFHCKHRLQWHTDDRWQLPLFKDGELKCRELIWLVRSEQEACGRAGNKLQTSWISA